MALGYDSKYISIIIQEPQLKDVVTSGLQVMLPSNQAYKTWPSKHHVSISIYSRKYVQDGESIAPRLRLRSKAALQFLAGHCRPFPVVAAGTDCTVQTVAGLAAGGFDIAFAAAGNLRTQRRNSAALHWR